LYQLYFYTVSCAFEWNSVHKTAKIAAPKQRHNVKLSFFVSLDPSPKTESRSRHK
jgi:hypothetical protein